MQTTTRRLAGALLAALALAIGGGQTGYYSGAGHDEGQQQPAAEAAPLTPG